MKEQWAWTAHDSEDAHGPFDTRKDAIEDAVFGCATIGIFYVGVVKHIDIESCMPSLDDILETADEYISDNYARFDDIIIESRTGAREKFKELIKTFADTYLYAASWYMETDEELIGVERPSCGHPHQDKI